MKELRKKVEVYDIRAWANEQQSLFDAVAKAHEDNDASEKDTGVAAA